jgi:excisionase family DNA binding protein
LLLGASAPATAERLLTVREAAEMLRVQSVTVYKLCSLGKLPHVRVSNAIRIRRDALERWLRERESET